MDSEQSAIKKNSDIYATHGYNLAFYSLIVIICIGFLFFAIGSLNGYAFILGGIVEINLNGIWIGAILIIIGSISLVLMFYYLKPDNSSDK
jgi:uncharacterized membrane protein YgaE (UPF0421/DUF939 family)